MAQIVATALAGWSSVLRCQGHKTKSSSACVCARHARSDSSLPASRSTAASFSQATSS